MYINIGKDPSTIERSQTYLDNLNYLGDSANNIKIIKNFVSEEDCVNIIESATLIKDESSNQWKNKAYSGSTLATSYIPSIEKEMLLAYGFPVKILSEHSAVMKWTAGDSMGLHADDLGIFNYHIAGLIYLNENYEGGELGFPKQKIVLKPSSGDLVIFPGNMNYPHEVMKVIYGDRYTMPVWAMYLDN
jgi:hypothetical protein